MVYYSLIGSKLDGESNGDFFGFSTALSGDGNVLAIGAPLNEGELTEISSVVGQINNNTSFHYNVAGNKGWNKTHIYERLYPDGEELTDYDWEFRTDLRVLPLEPYADNPFIDVIEISNLSNGNPDIFGVIFDNVEGTTGADYSVNAFGIDWTYKDDIAYVIEDTNNNSLIDSNDVILAETNINGVYSDFGGLQDGREKYNFSINDIESSFKSVGLDAGSVKVYQNNNNNWVQLGNEILGVRTGSRVGVSLSLSEDGKILAVGSPLSLNSSFGAEPLVSLYKLDNGVWSQIGNGIIGDSSNVYQGYSISLSSDGSALAVGSFWDKNTYVDNNGVEQNGDNDGNVKVYRIQNDSISQIGNDIKGGKSDACGFSVSLSSNGNIVALSYPDEGYVKVFENNNNSWSQIGSNIVAFTSTTESHKKAISVDISNDATFLVMGNPSFSDKAGQLKVYQYVNNDWSQIGSDIDGTPLSRLGDSVQISSDGLTVAASGSSNGTSGYTKVFKYINSSWILYREEEINQNDHQYEGRAISLSDDGQLLAVGSSHNQLNSQEDGGFSAGYLGYEEDSGNVGVYKLIPNAPTSLSTTTTTRNDSTPTITGSAEAGSTVKLYSGTTLLGSTTADSKGNFSITSSNLDDGKYELTATSTDIAGNTSSSSEALSLTVV
ncbi:Ig-like domain-containing protein, partial [Prochlorococcus sp. AH-736-L17]